MYDERTDGGHLGLIIIVRHTVVSNQRIGHDNCLVCIRGVRQYLLISYHGRVEYDLTYAVACVPKGKAVIFFSVLKYDLSVFLHCFTSFCAFR